MQLLNALIATVELFLNIRMNSDFCVFIQFKVVTSPFLKMNTDNLASIRVYDKLYFVRMTFLFAAIFSFLFGRTLNISLITLFF